MGATNFWDKAKGKNVNEAFLKAKEEAYYEHGHGGYSGTIAEKPSATLVEIPDGMSVDDFINAVEGYEEGDMTAPVEVRKAYKIWDDKWGPAVAVKDEIRDTFIFFGLASC